jgi:hypothetical protein
MASVHEFTSQVGDPTKQFSRLADSFLDGSGALEEAMRDLFWLSDAAWAILEAGSSPSH